MTELETIVAALDAAGGGVAVLATLMQVDGSAYRGPGARLVVLPDGATVGAISGGCLEKDVTAHAERVRTTLTPECVTYDLTRDDDAPWGLNMGCNARLDVLLEPCHGVPPWLGAAAEAERGREGAVLASCFRAPPAGPRVGDHLVLRADTTTAAGPLAEGTFGGTARGEAHRVLREERSDVVASPSPAGEVAVLYEYVARPVELVVCGEGADTAPLLAMAEVLGWHTRRVGKDDPLGPVDDRSAVVVMTHNYGRDLDLLVPLLASHARYIGMLGPRRRTERLLADAASRGHRPSPLDAVRLHAPVGLDLGAETPAEVALAIAAEVRATFAGRSGGALRERRGPIHDRR